MQRRHKNQFNMYYEQGSTMTQTGAISMNTAVVNLEFFPKIINVFGAIQIRNYFLRRSSSVAGDVFFERPLFRR